MQLGMSVRRAQEEINSAEFSEWMAFYNVEPFGVDRNDLPIAILGKRICDMWKAKGSPPFDIDYFLPNIGKPEWKEAMSPMEMQHKIKTMFAGMKK